MILLDSNILIYLLNKGSPFHKKAQSILNSKKDFCVTTQNILETYRVITSKEYFDTFYSSKEAWDKLDVITNNITVLDKTNITNGHLKELCLKYKINSYQIYDTHLVAIMIENGIKTIYTNNEKDFKKFKEIVVKNPFI